MKSLINKQSPDDMLAAIETGYATPFWVKELVTTIAEKDIVEATNWLETLAAIYAEKIATE